MKESEAKMLVSHDAIKEVVVMRSELGARSTSEELGWVVCINGESLASARKPQRVFASLDTVAETLEILGIANYTVCGVRASKVPTL